MVTRVKATKKAVEVEVPEPVKLKYGVPLGVYAQFTKDDDSFIGIVQSLEPLTIIEHSMSNGVHSETESDVLSLEGWTVEPMNRQAVFEALY